MRSIRRKSILQEEETAKMIGGKRRRGSGSVPGLPGDAVSDRFLVECKFTSKRYISIKASDLRKIEEDALSTGKIPILAFGFSNGDTIEGQWTAIPSYLFYLLNK